MRLLLLLLPLILATGCATNPVTGKSEIAIISESQELAIGNGQYMTSQQSQGGEYKVDPELGAYVSEVGQRVAAVSDRSLPYEFVVLNSSVPNAWALPGGKIAINRGLLTELENEAELAAVLGHEVVHSAARHGAKSMERGIFLQTAIGLTALATQDSEYSNYIVGAAGLGAQLISTKYGRNAELESDFYGIQYMARAGYDATAAISLQEKFVALSGGRSSNWLDGLLASHPPSEERVLKNAETAAALPIEQQDGILGAERYQQAMAYVRSKGDAYRAYDQARALFNKKQYAPALSSVNEAIRIEPGDAIFHGLKGEIARAQGNYKSAEKHYNDALRLDDAYFAHYLGRGIAYSKLGNHAAAKNDLARANQLLPNAVAMNELGIVSLATGDAEGAKAYFQQAMSAGGELGQSARSAFVQLDLPENPNNYFSVNPFVQEGRILATIANRAGLPISEAEVTVNAVINGTTQQRKVVIGPIGPDQQGTVAIGINLKTEDQLTGLYAAVTRARF